jgi:hypothetical protein
MGDITEYGITFQSEAGKVTGLEFDDGQGDKLVAKKLPEIVPTSQAVSTPGVWWVLAPALLLRGVAVAWILFKRARPQKRSE